MGASWYYVENNERVGPVDESEILTLIHSGELTESNYVWKKGYENWTSLSKSPELKIHLKLSVEENIQENASVSSDVPEVIEKVEEYQNDFNWNNILDSDQRFMIKVGVDRGVKEEQYGPFSIEMIRNLLNEKRVNEKTLIFAPGMGNWTLLGKVPQFEKLLDSSEITEEFSEKRDHDRKPIVARLFFHDSRTVFEGVCRDISIGGLQIMIANFPGKIGEVVKLNVHPEKNEFSFTAEGKVVRLLNGNAGISVRFVNMSHESINKISNYIESIE